MNIFHKVLELWPGHESGMYRSTDGWTDRRTGRTGVTLNPFRYSSNKRGHKNLGKGGGGGGGGGGTGH